MRPHLVADLLALLARLLSGAAVRLQSEAALGEGQRVYVANHSSHLDFIVLWAALPAAQRRTTRPVAAGDYWDKSALRRYLAVHVYRAILIEREGIAAHNNPIEVITREMGTDSIILFPEGTRGTGDEVGEFRSGIYHLISKRPDLPCVPVYIENLNRILPKGEILPLPLLSSISLGHPVHLQPGEKKREFLQRLRGAVVELKRDGG